MAPLVSVAEFEVRPDEQGTHAVRAFDERAPAVADDERHAVFRILADEEILTGIARLVVEGE